MSYLSAKPNRPEEHECCGGGCSPCVWDFYYEDLERWQEQQKNDQNESTELES